MTARLVLCLVIAASAALVGQVPTTPDQPDFATWLAALRSEALARGISPATVDRALADVKEPEPVIVARDRAQPEQVQSLDRYVAQRVVPQVRRSAQAHATKHADVLARVSARFGVPRGILVAIWGLESNFGRFTGVRPVIASLATLAYDPRRASLFRQELFEALTIIDQRQVAPDQLRGSWAGAMGQPQFMPSTYLKHAVDFDGDGIANIWTSEADVFASIANYLRHAGWVDGERWGREVRLSTDALARIEKEVPMRRVGCRAVREMTEARPLADWVRLGAVQINGARLPAAHLEASLVRGLSRHFLVYRNYDALIDYNCAHSYAISAGLLSDSIQ